MTTATLEPTSSTAAGANPGRIYAGVDHFDPSPAHPAGSCGIVKIDPILSTWEWVLERHEPIRSLSPIEGGRRLAFMDEGDHPGLWVLNPENNLALDLVARLRGQGRFAAPDHGTEFFLSMNGIEARRARKAGLWKVSADGMKWSRLPFKARRTDPTDPQDYRVVDCSSDGEWLLLVKGRHELHRVRPNGTDGDCLTWPDECLIHPRFAPDGDRIVVTLAADAGESLWVMNHQGTDRTCIIPESPAAIVAFWSPTSADLVLNLSDRVRNDRGKLSVPRDPAARRSRIEVIAADGTNRRPLDLPTGDYFLGGWSSV